MPGNTHTERQILASRDYWIAAAITAIAIAVFALHWRYAFTDRWFSPMGGESTIGAFRVLRGEIPYRDFWTLYAPGHFYLLAAIFAIFGEHLMVEVVAASFVCAAAIGALYLLVQTVTERRLLAIGSSAILLAAMFNSEYYYFRFETYPPTILLVILSVLLAATYFRREQRRFLIWSAFCAGLIILNKHDVGVYTSAAIGVGLLVHHYLGSDSNWRRLIGNLATFAAVEAAVAAPVFLYFVAAAGWDLYHDIVRFPLTDWRFAKPDSYPSFLPHFQWNVSSAALADQFFEYIKFTVPLLLNISGLVAAALAMRRRNRTLAAITVTCWIAFWCHFTGAHLQVNTHIVTMAAYASAVGSFLLVAVSGEVSSRSRRILMLTACLVASGWFLALVIRPAAKLALRYKDPVVTLTLPRVSGFYGQPEGAKQFESLVAFVDKNVRPDQPIYVGLNRHDALVANDMLTYLVLNRPIPIRYHDLHGAVADRPAAQQEMVAGFEAAQPPLVIIRPFFNDAVLDGVKAELQRNVKGVGSTILDEYLKSHYAPAAEFAPYQVWMRRTQPLARTEARQ